jgi:hypothetical protein
MRHRLNAVRRASRTHLWSNLQGLSVALFAVTGGLAAMFAGCGGGASGATTTSAAGTSASSGATSAGGNGGNSGETTSSGASTGAGGAASCASCAVVATLPAGSAPVGLAAFADNIYWTNSGTHEVMQAKTDGSSPVTLAAGQSTPYAVQVSAGFVYWVSYSATGVMRRTPIGGGPITDVVEAVAARDLYVGADAVFWTNDPDDIQTFPLSGVGVDAGTTTLFTGNPLINGLTSDGTAVFWVNRGDGAIKRSSPDLSGNDVLVLGHGDVPWDIAVDGTSYYWTEAGTPPKLGRVMKASKVSGMNPVTIATNQESPHGIAIDAAHVYWASRGDGTIHKAPLAGGADTVLAAGQLTPENVVVDSEYVYWTDPKADRIVRVAK